jgi:threonine/homoserine/homoserine lactone efflux protein
MPILLLLFALLLGIVATIPVGPVQVETVKRAIGGHLTASELVVLGSATSDVIYGVIALYGIAPVLEIAAVRAALNGAAVAILWILAYLTWRHSATPEKLHRPPKFLASGRWAYTTGFLLGMSNPPIIASWLFGVAIARHFGLVPAPFSAGAKALFVAGAVLGAWGYLTVLAVATHRVRHFFPPRTVQKVYRGLAVTLLLLSFYFAREFVLFLLRVS